MLKISQLAIVGWPPPICPSDAHRGLTKDTAHDKKHEGGLQHYTNSAREEDHQRLNVLKEMYCKLFRHSSTSNTSMTLFPHIYYEGEKTLNSVKKFIDMILTLLWATELQCIFCHMNCLYRHWHNSIWKRKRRWPLPPNLLLMWHLTWQKFNMATSLWKIKIVI